MLHQNGSQKEPESVRSHARPTTKCTLVVSIPIDLDEALRREAAEKGRPVSWVAADWLRRGRRAPAKAVKS